MKKLLAIVLALMICALPVLASADTAWINNAYQEGRKITTEFSFASDMEELKALNDVRVTAEVQKEPELIRIAGDYAGKNIVDASIGTNDAGDTLYFQSALLGKTIALREGDLIAIGEQIIDAIVSMGLASEEDVAQLRGLLEGTVEAEPDGDILVEDLDLSYLFNGLLAIGSKINFVDCEDYELTTMDEFLADAYMLRDDEYVSDEMLAPYTAALEATKARKISMLMNLTLTEDDVLTLLDSIMATIYSNPQLASLLAPTLEKLYEQQEKALDGMVEDLSLTVGIDAAGIPVFATASYSVNSGDGILSIMANSVNASDDVNKVIAFNLSAAVMDMSDLTGVKVDYQELLTAIDVNTPDANLFWLIVGNSAEANHFNVILDSRTLSADENEETTHADLMLVLESEQEDLIFKFADDCKMTKNGDDFALVESLSFIDNTTEQPIATLNINMFSGESTAFTDENAVFPVEMDEDAQLNLIDEVVDNAAARIEEVAGILENKAPVAAEEAVNPEAIEPAEALEAEPVEAEGTPVEEAAPVEE